MRTNTGLWWLLAAFFALMARRLHDRGASSRTPTWSSCRAVEWVGSVALLFTALMSILIAFYIGRVHNAQGGELPEDLLTSDIDDGDPELGEFSPWSWWPIMLAFSAALGIMGLAIGNWLFPIGLGVFLVAIVGWVYEYYRGYFAR